MERKRCQQVSVFIRATTLVGLFIQNLAIPAMADANFDDQKNFLFPPYPYPGTTPPVLYSPPPAHGSHGGEGSGGPQPHPHAPSPPTRGSGGGGGGGYRHSPPTATTPGTTAPGVVAPSPRLPLDPNSPPFTCTYWRNHPTLIWGVLGWWGTVGTAFGVASLPAGSGPHMNLLQALSNTRTDGFGQLYREGTAALLNSMVDTKFPDTTAQVRDSFSGALTSDKAAAAQAQVFKLANEAGGIKPRF